MLKRPLFILFAILVMSNAVLALDGSFLLPSSSASFTAVYNFIQHVQSLSSISLSPNFKILIDPSGYGCALNLSPAVTLKASNTNNHNSLTISVDLSK
jgi:hypothetical protein